VKVIRKNTWIGRNSDGKDEEGGEEESGEKD
jgi:hypothetical protein